MMVRVYVYGVRESIYVYVHMYTRAIQNIFIAIKKI